jgi:hypothetical protein
MTRSPGRSIASVFMAALLLAPSSFAFDLSLSDQAIREAYFLGQRNDDKTAAFFMDYIRHLPLPEKGPYVSEVELLTPFAQIVQQSSQVSVGYSAQQAKQEYEARGDLIRARVRIEFTPTYDGIESHRPSRDSGKGDSFTPRPVDFWKDFGFTLKQDKEIIKSNQLYSEPIFGDDGTFVGAYVWLNYAAQEVASADISVEVDTPDGQHVAVRFDLTRLR